MTEDEIIKEMSAIPRRCHICECLDQFEFASMAKIQHQITADDRVKLELRDKGLCNYHFWAIASITSNKTAAAMCRIFFDSNGFLEIGCLICEHLTAKESALLREFVKEVTKAAVKEKSRFDQNREEETSWWRAVENLVGRKGMIR